ncbi:MAG: polyprenyl synthetase family protein, partial [Dehalococcoidia bacterium]|nr:polyprenyl synthetase family protein [Dehalococcoidia bacterium]
SRTLMAMAAGELTQDMSAYQYGQDTMQYFQRIAGKTASLFAASAEGGAIIAGAPPAWTEALRYYGESVGMAFQIVDDILDFEGDEAELGKPAGSDLMEGTLTLPALLLMERNPDDNPIKHLFDNRHRKEHVAEAIAMIQESDILDESYRVARDFRDRAVTALEPLPDSSDRAALVDLAELVVQRRSKLRAPGCYKALGGASACPSKKTRASTARRLSACSSAGSATMRSRPAPNAAATTCAA